MLSDARKLPSHSVAALSERRIYFDGRRRSPLQKLFNEDLFCPPASVTVAWQIHFCAFAFWVEQAPNAFDNIKSDIRNSTRSQPGDNRAALQRDWHCTQ
jgi:hypothetical protein